MTHMTNRCFGLLLACTSVLFACGDGGGPSEGNPDAQTGSDAGALATVASFELSVGCTDLAFDGTALWCLAGAQEAVHELDATGRVTRTLNGPGSYPAGLTFDGQSLWVGDGFFGTGLVYRLDRSEDSSLPAPEGAPITGLAFDGTHLWAIDSLEPRIHQLAPDGSILGSLDCPGSLAGGLTYDGEHLWVASFDQGQVSLYQLDKTTGSVLSSFDVDGLFAGGLTFDGNALWYASPANDLVTQYDLAGNVLGSFETPGGAPQDLAFDGTYLWNADGDVSPGPDQIFQLDTTGNVIASLQSPGSSPGGLTFDGEHLWQADQTTGRIHRLTTTGGDLIPLPGFEPDFLAFDGSHFWGGADQQLHRFDLSGDLVSSVDHPCADLAGLDATPDELWVLCGQTGIIETLHRLDLTGASLAVFDSPSLMTSPLEAGFAFDGTYFWLVATETPIVGSRLYQLRLPPP